MEALIHCAKHQNRIADDVLQLSKLSMNLVSLTETAFDPFIEVKNCLRMFEREATVKEIDMKLSIGEGYDALQVATVCGDPIRYAQVLLNFLSNAIRFTEKAPHRTIEITLNASEEEPILASPTDDIADLKTHVSLASPPSISTPARAESLYLISSVSDSGVGISEEEQKKLFQKFTQASPKTHIEYGGSGLGLFISKALVEAHGGKLSLESEEGEGTKLTFYIHVKRVDPEGAVQENGKHPSRNRSPLAAFSQRKEFLNSSASDSRGISVLVVEDNLVIETPYKLTED
jgi:signal transduction histidine kinase